MEKINISDIHGLIQFFLEENALFKDVTMDVEVGEIKVYKMVYLKLSDKTGSIDSVIYPNNYILKLAPGEKIKAKGRISLYNGRIQFNIRTYDKLGIGDNNYKLTNLKNKLSDLGYFDNKAELKSDYQNVAIITSLNAAGLKDFLFTLNAKCENKKLYLYPATVQGSNALIEIPAAISMANAHKRAEVIVLIRGGGSKEDLECFNSLEIAQAIHESKIPIATGIGHQVDTSIADLVCDKSFITPTAVAQNLFVENLGLNTKIKSSLDEIKQKLCKLLQKRYHYLENMERELKHSKNLIINEIDSKIRLENQLKTNLKEAIFWKIDSYYKYLQISSETLFEVIKNLAAIVDNNIVKSKNQIKNFEINCGEKLLNYEQKMELIGGPIITNSKGKIVKSAKQIIPGETYTIAFSDGSINFTPI